MLNFTFQNPTRILFGQGRIADLAKEVPAGRPGPHHLRRAAAWSRPAP